MPMHAYKSEVLPFLYTCDIFQNRRFFFITVMFLQLYYTEQNPLFLNLQYLHSTCFTQPSPCLRAGGGVEEPFPLPSSALLFHPSSSQWSVQLQNNRPQRGGERLKSPSRLQSGNPRDPLLFSLVEPRRCR